jgi:hypothetical protein
LQRFAAFLLGSPIGRSRAIPTLVGQRVLYQRSIENSSAARVE